MYQPLYGPKGLVIFDHPYNAEYVFVMAAMVLLVGGMPIVRLCRAPEVA